ncbi:MAG: GIY-YIG nuclease family protein [Patescibacteria group bacterium]|jgi:putative endonuclease
MREKAYYVYLMTNKANNVIYTGVANDLERRVYEHKNKLIEGFTSKYNANKLVYFEETDDIGEAIKREKQIEGGSRQDKINLINVGNPKWEDLSKDWY